MKNNTQLKTFTAPKGINSIKSGVFFAIALIAGNIIFTIVALILDFLSEPLRLVFALITSIAMIVYIYIEHYYDFTYGHKLNHRNLNNGNSNLFLIFRSQGTFALVLILLLYTIRTIVIFQEIDTLVPLSNNTVTLDNPPNLINPNNFHVTNINQDISYGGPLYIYPDINIEPTGFVNSSVPTSSHWNSEVVIKVNLANQYIVDSNIETLTVGLNYLCLIKDGKVSGVLLTLYPSKSDRSFVVNGLNQYGDSAFSLEWNNLLHITVQATDDPSLKWVGFLPLGCNNALKVDNSAYDVSWMYYINIPKLQDCKGFDLDMICKVK